MEYKKFLKISFTGSILILIGVMYYACYIGIPSHIHIRAGEKQTLDFGVPVTGKLTKMEEVSEAVAVSEQPESHLPKESISMDLSRFVTLQAVNTEAYCLELKLFGFLPLKQVEVQVIEDEKLIPAGIPIGIYVKTEGVLVIGVGEFKNQSGADSAPSRYLLKSGDYILKVNGEKVQNKAFFVDAIQGCQGRELILTVLRNEEMFDVKVLPCQDENGVYKLGIWIRDNAQGVGTLTFVREDGKFGALGHGINDVDTRELLKLESGTLYHTDIIAIRKGVNGTPGEMTGMIEYSRDHVLGEIEKNSEKGIFGTGNGKLQDRLVTRAVPILLKQELKKGPAQIICTIDGITDVYTIEITEVNQNHDNVNRGIVLEITDSRLLEKTGGIIQGMSGAPIIQNGRLAGAVTHVLVQDSTKGYGIFIENMLEYDS